VALTGVLANCGSDGPAASDRQRSRERPQLGPTARSAAIACGARSAADPDGRSARYLSAANESVPGCSESNRTRGSGSSQETSRSEERIGFWRTLLGVRANEKDRQRFASMFDELSPRVFAYARRHCDATSAQDVVSDTFLVAWRRIDVIPADPLPWLLVVARNTIKNRRRHESRQERLKNALGRLEHLATPTGGADQQVVERAHLLEALTALSDLEREALLLVAWDGLSGPDAAKVAGCSLRAFEVRLSRARARLTRASQLPPEGSLGGDRSPLLRPISARRIAAKESQ
jgi:RNA polymerase sigma factor (sigma-70 family)